MVPLLVAEAMMAFPVLRGRQPLLDLLAPISLLTLGPMWGLQDALQSGWYGGFLAVLFLDIVFVSIMAFSITRNHKIIGGVCLFIFIFLSVGFVAVV